MRTSCQMPHCNIILSYNKVFFFCLSHILVYNSFFLFFPLFLLPSFLPPSSPPSLFSFSLSKKCYKKFLERFSNLFIYPHVKAFPHSTKTDHFLSKLSLTKVGVWRFREKGPGNALPTGMPAGSSARPQSYGNGGHCGLPGLREAGQWHH